MKLLSKLFTAVSAVPLGIYGTTCKDNKTLSQARPFDGITTVGSLPRLVSILDSLYAVSYGFVFPSFSVLLFSKIVFNVTFALMQRKRYYGRSVTSRDNSFCSTSSREKPI